MQLKINIYVFILSSFLPVVLLAENGPVAKNGIMDLRNYNFKMDGPVDLKGVYEFYWNQMLDPVTPKDTGNLIYVEVPSSWNQIRKHHPEVKRYGFATYRLLIKFPKDMEDIAFDVREVFEASAFYLDGKLIDYVGFPGVNKFQTVMKIRKHYIPARISDSQDELLIRVSNFEHRSGGIRGAIILGTNDQIREMREKEIYRSYFLIGAFLIVGIYFLGLHLIRYEVYRLYFALICILMVIRMIVVEELPVLDYLNLNGLTASRLEYLSFYFFVPFFTLMIRSLFPYEFPKLAFRSILWISVVFIIMVVVSPISLFSYTLPYFVVFFILVGGIFFYVLSLAWIRGRSHAPAFALGLLVLFLGAINDILYVTDLIETGYASPYAMFIYLMFYAYIFADKSNQLRRQTESLADEVNQVNTNLEELVEERTQELQTISSELENQKLKLESSNQELTDAIQARNKLFSIIGHDIKAPIGYIKQALVMLMEDENMSPEQRDEMVRLMARSSDSTFNLLENLLVWGRSQTGNLKANPVSFKLKTLIDECTELMNIAIHEKKLKVTSSIAESHYLFADRDQFSIVIRNLLSNAIKFSPEKGTIRINSRKNKSEIIIDVQDTGIGIPSSIRDRLFKSDEHVSTDGTNGEKGSGLGLKLSYEIIRANNGWISIESAIGKGSTFTLGVPGSR